MKLILLLFLILLTSCGNVKEPPKAVKGILDLRDWDFVRHGPINLSGQWNFYWGQLKEPKISKDSDEKTLINVPGPWLKDENPQIKRLGFGTYVLEVIGIDTKDALALRVPAVFSSYKLFLVHSTGNRAPIELFSIGRVSKDVNDSIPNFKDDVKSFKGSQRFFLFVQVSNYHFRNGGLHKTPILGLEKEI